MGIGGARKPPKEALAVAKTGLLCVSFGKRRGSDRGAPRVQRKQQQATSWADGLADGGRRGHTAFRKASVHAGPQPASSSSAPAVQPSHINAIADKRDDARAATAGRPGLRCSGPAGGAGAALSRRIELFRSKACHGRWAWHCGAGRHAGAEVRWIDAGGRARNGSFFGGAFHAGTRARRARSGRQLVGRVAGRRLVQRRQLADGEVRRMVFLSGGAKTKLVAGARACRGGAEWLRSSRAQEQRAAVSGQRPRGKR